MNPPLGQLYSSTKAMVSNWGEAIHYEVDDKIDVLAWNPAGIKTKIFTEGKNMTQQEYDKSSQSCTFLTPEQSVKGMLADLGRTAVSSGHIKHEFVAWNIQFWNAYAWECCCLKFSKHGTKKFIETEKNK